jgi:hypothetical protein
MPSKGLAFGISTILTFSKISIGLCTLLASSGHGVALDSKGKGERWELHTKVTHQNLINF